MIAIELPEGYVFARASKGRRGAILPIHIAPPSPHYEGLPARRALCGSEPGSGFHVVHEVAERALAVCGRCADRLARIVEKSNVVNHAPDCTAVHTLQPALCDCEPAS